MRFYWPNKWQEQELDHFLLHPGSIRSNIAEKERHKGFTSQSPRKMERLYSLLLVLGIWMWKNMKYDRKTKTTRVEFEHSINHKRIACRSLRRACSTPAIRNECNSRMILFVIGKRRILDWQPFNSTWATVFLHDLFCCKSILHLHGVIYSGEPF